MPLSGGAMQISLFLISQCILERWPCTKSPSLAEKEGLTAGYEVLTLDASLSQRAFVWKGELKMRTNYTVHVRGQLAYT